MAGALPGSRRGGGRRAEEMGDAALGVGSRLAAPSQKSWEVEKSAFWRRINYRVLVSKEQCKQVMALAPNHEALSRCRPLGHGGARRMRKESFVPSGPQLPTPKCSKCLAAESVGAQWRGWPSQVGGRSICSLHSVTEAVMPFSSMNNLRKPKRRE